MIYIYYVMIYIYMHDNSQYIVRITPTTTHQPEFRTAQLGCHPFKLTVDGWWFPWNVSLHDWSDSHDQNIWTFHKIEWECQYMLIIGGFKVSTPWKTWLWLKHEVWTKRFWPLILWLTRVPGCLHDSKSNPTISVWDPLWSHVLIHIIRHSLKKMNRSWGSYFTM